MGSTYEKNGINNGGNGIAKTVWKVDKAIVKELPQKRTPQFSVRRIFWGAGFVLAIVSLAGVIFLSRQSGKEFEDASKSVTHTREVLEKIATITAQLSEMESAARSFAISGKQTQLSPFYTAAEVVPPQVTELKLLLQNDSAEFQSVKEIEPIITKHLQVMKSMVALGDKNLFRGFGQRNLTDQGNDLMEQIRSVFSKLENDQRSLLAQEQRNVMAKADFVTLISFTASILASMFVVVCGAWALSAIKGRKKAEEKLDRLLGSMPDALVIINAEGKIVGSNAHMVKLFGYTERELQGESMALLVPERFRLRHGAHLAGYLRDPTAREMGARIIDLFARRADGTEFPAGIRLAPIQDGEHTFVAAAIRDMTERRAINDALVAAREEADRAERARFDGCLSVTNTARELGVTRTALFRWLARAEWRAAESHGRT